MADELRRTTFALNYWREKVYALMDENERIKRQRDTLSAQLQSLADLQGRQIAGYQQALQAQMNAQMTQQMQPAQYQGLQQAMQQNAYAYCNCVPSRAQAFDNENTHRQEG